MTITKTIIACQDEQANLTHEIAFIENAHLNAQTERILWNEIEIDLAVLYADIGVNYTPELLAC